MNDYSDNSGKSTPRMSSPRINNSKRKTVVCMDWWPDNNCKKSDIECDYLHIYDKDKLPLCYSKYLHCCPDRE